MLMYYPVRRTQDKLLDSSRLCIEASLAPKLEKLQDTKPSNSEFFPALEAYLDELLHLKSALEASRSLFTRSYLSLKEQMREYGAEFVLSQLKGDRAMMEQARRMSVHRAGASARKESVNQRGCVSTSDRLRSNATSVWSRVEVFYEPLPTDQEFDALFAKRQMPQDVGTPEGVEHWSRRFVSPSVRANGRAEMPPGPPPSESDVAAYWRTNRASFQIEKTQKHNSSVLHRLLNAMVVVERQPPAKVERNVDAPMIVHALLPQLNVGEHVQYGFDARLAMELESLGLNEQSVRERDIVRPFQQEIEAMKKEIDEVIVPDLDRMYRELKARLPLFREIEKKRNLKDKIVGEVMKEYQANKKGRR